MEQKNVQAQFQLQDSYVDEFNIKTLKKINNKEVINVSGQLGFKINSIRENSEMYIGQIELINDLKLIIKNEEYSTIHISMIGLFTGRKTEEYTKEKFETMLKINGATTLSHLIRAYIYTVTGLSGIPQITTPMVNFTKFFETAVEKKEEEEDNK